MAGIKTDRDAFRLRLKIARLRRGFVTTEDAAAYLAALPEAQRFTERSYKGWETGERMPGNKADYQRLEEEYGVTPRGWLSKGAGESLEDLNKEFARLDTQKRKQVRVARRKMADSPSLIPGESSGSVYQLTRNSTEFDVKSSQFVPVRRIPVLSGNDIARFLAGERESLMEGPNTVIPENLNASEDAYIYVIPLGDEAMVGSMGVSFPPGTELVFDPARDVMPGNFLLGRPLGLKTWLFRRYSAGLPRSVASEFTLEALNPAVEPIRVTDPGKWEFAGRLILTFHKW